MSAFIVSNHTMNKAINAVERATGRDTHGAWSAEQFEAFGNRLFAMNIEAVCQRYDETQERKAELLEMYRCEWTGCFRKSDMEVLKALQCLIYQCSEGNVPDTWPEYLQLRDAERIMLQRIVSIQPEYEAADRPHLSASSGCTFTVGELTVGVGQGPVGPALCGPGFDPGQRLLKAPNGYVIGPFRVGSPTTGNA